MDISIGLFAAVPVFVAQDHVQQVPVPSGIPSSTARRVTENRWFNRPETYSNPWLVTNFRGHTGEVLDMDFSNNSKYLASNAEDDNDDFETIHEVSMFSESTRRMSLDPYRSFHRKEKRSIRKRTSLSPRRSHDLPLWTQLKMTEDDLYGFLNQFVLSEEELFNLGYPCKNFDNHIIIYKGLDSPRFTGSSRCSLPTTQECVSSNNFYNNDSGISSASGNSSDSTESIESLNSSNSGKSTADKGCNLTKPIKRKTSQKRQKTTDGNLNSHHMALPSAGATKRTKPSEQKYSNDATKDIANSSMHFLHRSIQTYEPTITNHNPEPKYETVRTRRIDGSFFDKDILLHPMYPEYKTSVMATSHICARCAEKFYLQRGRYMGFSICHYHPSKLLNKDGELRFSCCSGLSNSKPCKQTDTHVWSGLQRGLNGPFDTFQQTVPKQNILYNHGIYAIDCEMVYTQYGMEVAKVTVVNVRGVVVYETYVKPLEDVWDYNTHYSGITSKHLEYARPLSQVRNELLNFINAKTILIGHGLENDLRTLKIIHKRCIDTTSLYPHHNGLPYKRSLKSLAWCLLRKEIQKDSHCSTEDSITCVELVLWMVRARRAQINN